MNHLVQDIAPTLFSEMSTEAKTPPEAFTVALFPRLRAPGIDPGIRPGLGQAGERCSDPEHKKKNCKRDDNFDGQQSSLRRACR